MTTLHYFLPKDLCCPETSIWNKHGPSAGSWLIESLHQFCDILTSQMKNWGRERLRPPGTEHNVNSRAGPWTQKYDSRIHSLHHHVLVAPLLCTEAYKYIQIQWTLVSPSLVDFPWFLAVLSGFFDSLTDSSSFYTINFDGLQKWDGSSGRTVC